MKALKKKTTKKVAKKEKLTTKKTRAKITKKSAPDSPKKNGKTWSSKKGTGFKAYYVINDKGARVLLLKKGKKEYLYSSPEAAKKAGGWTSSN